MIIFFFFLCAHNIGLFRYPPGGWQAFGDITNISFFIISLYFYLKRRKFISKTHFRQLEIFWLLFFIYFLISALTSHSNSKYGSIGNIRLVYPYFLFFGTIAVLTTQEKINRFIQILIIYGILGGLVSIWQSLHGTTPLFDPMGFYNIGHWAGQRSYITPGIARVMLPPLYLIYVIFISLFLYGIVFKDHKYYPLMIFFMIPIFIGFARSQWLAVIIAIVSVMILLARFRTIKISRLMTNVILLGIALSLSLWILDKFLGGNIITQMGERAALFFYDINSEKGTYASRLSTIAICINLWRLNPLWGYGAGYAVDIQEPAFSDVGFTYVLITIGLIGLILLMALYISIMIFSYKIIKLAKQSDDAYLYFAGMVTLSIPIFLFIAQQYTQGTFSNVLLSLSIGYCTAQYRVFLKNIKQDALPS